MTNRSANFHFWIFVFLSFGIVWIGVFLFFWSKPAGFIRSMLIAEFHASRNDLLSARKYYLKALEKIPGNIYLQQQLVALDSTLDRQRIITEMERLLQIADSLFVSNDTLRAHQIYREVALRYPEAAIFFEEIVPDDSINWISPTAAAANGIEKPSGLKGYGIVTGIFENYQNAVRMSDTLKNLGVSPVIILFGRKPMHAVIHSIWEDPEEAHQKLQKVRQHYRSDAWILFLDRE